MGGEGKRLRMNILSYVKYHAILQFILELLEVSAVPMFTIIKVKIGEISCFFNLLVNSNIASVYQRVQLI